MHIALIVQLLHLISGFQEQKCKPVFVTPPPLSHVHEERTIATRPCLSSAWRNHARVASEPYSEMPIGSQYLSQRTTTHPMPSDAVRSRSVLFISSSWLYPDAVPRPIATTTTKQGGAPRGGPGEAGYVWFDHVRTKPEHHFMSCR